MRTGQGARTEIPDMTWFFQAGGAVIAIERRSICDLKLGGTTVTSIVPVAGMQRGRFFYWEKKYEGKS